MAELKWIEDFLDLSGSGNFTLTAENRNITQSALSKRIKQLEGWFGSELFERSSRAVTLTADGEAFLPVAVDIVKQLTHVRGLSESPSTDHAEAVLATARLTLGQPAKAPSMDIAGARSSTAKAIGGLTDPQPPRAQQTVLLADDSEVALTVLARMVEREGCDVVLATSGEEAVEEFQRTSPVLVFTDWEMPGMSGVELASRLRTLSENGPIARVPIIAVTGHTKLDDVRRCFDVGMDDYLSKPVGATEVQTVLHRWVPGFESIEALENLWFSNKAQDGNEPTDHQLLRLFCEKHGETVEGLADAIDREQFDTIASTASSLRIEAEMIGAYSFARVCRSVTEAASKSAARIVMQRRGPFLAEYVRLERASTNAVTRSAASQWLLEHAV